MFNITENLKIARKYWLFAIAEKTLTLHGVRSQLMPKERTMCKENVQKTAVLRIGKLFSASPMKHFVKQTTPGKHN